MTAPFLARARSFGPKAEIDATPMPVDEYGLICAFQVPGDIVPWGRARLGKGGIHYTDPKTKSYQAVIRTIAHQAMEKKPPFDGACRIRIDAYFPWPTSWSAKRREAEWVYKKSKPDTDNILKSVKDALSGVAYTDDARVADVRVTKQHSDMALLFVEVWEIRRPSGAVA